MAENKNQEQAQTANPQPPAPPPQPRPLPESVPSPSMGVCFAKDDNHSLQEPGSPLNGPTISDVIHPP